MAKDPNDDPTLMHIGCELEIAELRARIRVLEKENTALNVAVALADQRVIDIEGKLRRSNAAIMALIAEDPPEPDDPRGDGDED